VVTTDGLQRCGTQCCRSDIALRLLFWSWILWTFGFEPSAVARQPPPELLASVIPLKRTFSGGHQDVTKAGLSMGAVRTSQAEWSGEVPMMAEANRRSSQWLLEFVIWLIVCGRSTTDFSQDLTPDRDCGSPR